MSDDKTEQLEKLTQTYADILEGVYISIMSTCKQDKVEIATEDARGLAQTAMNRAHETLYPRYSSSTRGRGRGSGVKVYAGGHWDDPVTENQMKRLKWMIGKLETYFFENLKDTVGAKETAAETIKIAWAEKFESEVPESGSEWTEGQASWIMDALQQRFSELFPEKKEGQ